MKYINHIEYPYQVATSSNNKYLARFKTTENNNTGNPYLMYEIELNQYIFMNDIGRTSSLTNTINWDYRIATNQEIAWLEECFKLNKFIPFSEFIKQLNYEIY